MRIPILSVKFLRRRSLENFLINLWDGDEMGEGKDEVKAKSRPKLPSRQALLFPGRRGRWVGGAL